MYKRQGLSDAFARLEQAHSIDLRNEAHRWQVRAALAAIIEDWVGSLTLAETSTLLTDAGALWAPYKLPSELVAGDPLLTENSMFQRVEQPGIGTLWSSTSPYEFLACERLAAQPAPTLGEHTDAILSDILGLSSGQIGRLHDDKVVAGPR